MPESKIVYTKRKFCYKCRRELEFEHFSHLNPNLENIVNIFYSKYTQFYCCDCFGEKTGKKPSDFQCYSDFDDEEEFFMIFGDEF